MKLVSYIVALFETIIYIQIDRYSYHSYVYFTHYFFTLSHLSNAMTCQCSEAQFRLVAIVYNSIVKYNNLQKYCIVYNSTIVAWLRDWIIGLLLFYNQILTLQPHLKNVIQIDSPCTKDV